MKIVFAGTPQFGAASLLALVNAGHDVCCVLTMPDRPSGRGLKTKISPVKELALSLGLPVLQPDSLKSEEIHQKLADLAADIMVVSAYGHFLPKKILDLPPLGCVNVHASLLPRHRGAAPINHSIYSGDRFSGVSIIQMTSRLDAGAVCLAIATPIENMMATDLHDALATLGGFAICESLERLSSGKISWFNQAEEETTYAAKLEEKHTVDWLSDASEIDRAVRAFSLAPGVYTSFDGLIIRIHEVEIVSAQTIDPSLTPGSIISIDKTGISVICGVGVIKLTVLQKPGGKRIKAFDFSLGAHIQQGSSFDPLCPF